MDEIQKVALGGRIAPTNESPATAKRQINRQLARATNLGDDIPMIVGTQTTESRPTQAVKFTDGEKDRDSAATE